MEHVIATSLARSTRTEIHTLFQVSTFSALVGGLYQGAVRVGQLIERGNFGLGTFIDLDGEMVVIDGVCYKVEADGRVTTVESERLIPYAVVTECESARVGNSGITLYFGISLYRSRQILISKLVSPVQSLSL